MTNSKLLIDLIHADPGLAAFAQTDFSAASGLIARVTKLLDMDGLSPPKAEVQELVLPIGAPTLSVSVAPGFYSVEVVMPSGKLLNRQVDLREDTQATATFDLGLSPHGWMTMQHLEGATPDEMTYKSIMASGSKGLGRSRRGSVGGGPEAEFDPNMLIGPSTPVSLSEPYKLMTEQLATAESGTSVLLVRQDLRQASPEAATIWWSDLAKTLEQAQPFFGFSSTQSFADNIVVTSQGHDRWHEVWRLPSCETDGMRYFALVKTAKSAEIVSLPLPWSCEQLLGQDVIELSVDTSDVQRAARTSVTVLDPKLFTLLAYLKHGSMALGRKSQITGPGDSVLINALRAKQQNALAAAAAGLALIGASQLDREESWHSWIVNLDNWFDWLPDGAVLHARLKLIGAEGDAATAAGRGALLRAFHRGLPFYTLSLTWLLEGLRQFADDECQTAAALVRRVAVRADVGQAFTVLGVGPKPMEL